jgi:hypothetical protein
LNWKNNSGFSVHNGVHLSKDDDGWAQYKEPSVTIH